MPPPQQDELDETTETRSASPDWATDAEELTQSLGTTLELGLSDEAVLQRLERFGPNQIAEGTPTLWFQIAVRQLRRFVV